MNQARLKKLHDLQETGGIKRGHVLEMLNEIERLHAALRYEENRFSRVGTHSPSCWKWGPGHYECALRKIEEMEK